MPTTIIPEEELEIARRFYTAIDELISKKNIRGLGTLARQWGLGRFSLTWSKNHPNEKRIRVVYLYYIARDYKVSLDWLFFGTGEMFEG